jgi:glycerol-1-phosphate dehydrogenase [NAD(P)+]
MPKVEIRIEKGAIESVGEISKDLTLGNECLIVEDAITRKIAGVRIADSLMKTGFTVSEVVVDKPDQTSVEKTIQHVSSGGFLIGVGGTSVLDVTKLAAYKKEVRYVLFSTGIANSGIISKTSSIYVNGKKESISVGLADAVIVDLSVVSQAPPWMFAAGCGDLVIEATAIKDWQLGRDDMEEAYCESVAQLEMATLDQIIGMTGEIQSRTEKGLECLVDALIVSGLGMAMWGSSRPSSGSEHLWSHWLDHYAEEHKTAFGRHGEQVGVATLLLAEYHKAHNPDWWDEQRYPNYQAEALMSFLRTVGAPTKPSDFGVSRELAVRAFLEAWEYRKERYTILHKRHPNLQDAETIMKQLGM